MQKEIEAIKKGFEEDIKKVKDKEELKIAYLGRKGKLTLLLRSLGGLKIEEKKKYGPELNKLRKEIEDKLKKIKSLGGEERRGKDLTRPGKRVGYGSLHPLTITEEKILEIFKSMNFSVVLGPEVESEFYNFDALNIPAHHPAREMWDTFWLKGEEKDKERFLMRTHTSPVQVRFMEQNEPPFQIVVPGRVFRYEATDASHETNFYQVEGLMVGKEISLANLKFVIEEFLNKFFGKKLEFRFRPSYFPFVEPGIEVDIKMPGGKKWLEVMGAGMVHPEVLKVGGINPEEWQGFAFGMGVERLAMLKHNIPDIRLFYSGDLRFIKQF